MSALYLLGTGKTRHNRYLGISGFNRRAKKERIFYFRIFDEINNNNREIIRQYIIQKQVELFGTKNKENWHEKELNSLVRS
tara:strand:- start:306 stop:548 length:243 start_codon:yes stop_codon:yes gene_type:complete